MEDRRKVPYCGPKHKITPTLGVLFNCLDAINNLSEEVSMLNYGGHSKDIGIHARTGLAEIDKLIRIENKEIGPQLITKE